MISLFNKSIKNEDLVKLYQRERRDNVIPSTRILADYASYHGYVWDTWRLLWSKK